MIFRTLAVIFTKQTLPGWVKRHKPDKLRHPSIYRFYYLKEKLGHPIDFQDLLHGCPDFLATIQVS
jgi:hypothetical protein